MAPAPSARRTAAQAAAGKKFAAGGRAAQAAARAKGKKPSAAQHAASLKWAAAGRAARSARAGKKTPAPARKRTAVLTPETRLLAGWEWNMGCNDVAPTCAAAAVANHLLAATGIRMSDDEVTALHALAGGDDGATIAAVLEAAKEHWVLAGCHGKARLLAFTPTDADVIVAGLVVGVSLPHARHAVLSCPGGMISWGRVLPWAGEPEEAWALEWGWLWT